MRQIPKLFRSFTGVTAVVSLLLACGSKEEPADPVPLVSAAGWSETAEADDPFSDHRPQSGICESRHWGAESFGDGQALGVETSACSYVTLEQPLLASVRAGGRVQVRLWHFDLSATDSTEAHVALSTADQLLWEKTIPIPSESQLIKEIVVAEGAADKSAPIYFHVHNHGENAYALLDVKRLPN